MAVRCHREHSAAVGLQDDFRGQFCHRGFTQGL
jgi:hypothetical protein